jgi:CDGSH-type Zn-finger protein
MPEISEEVRNGHVRHIVLLQNGERVKLCRCQHSMEYPLCDGTHKTMDNTIGPVIVIVESPAPNGQK